MQLGRIDIRRIAEQSNVEHHNIHVAHMAAFSVLFNALNVLIPVLPSLHRRRGLGPPILEVSKSNTSIEV